MTESRPVPQFYNQTLLTKKVSEKSSEIGFQLVIACQA